MKQQKWRGIISYNFYIFVCVLVESHFYQAKMGESIKNPKSKRRESEMRMGSW